MKIWGLCSRIRTTRKKPEGSRSHQLRLGIEIPQRKKNQDMNCDISASEQITAEGRAAHGLFSCRDNHILDFPKTIWVCHFLFWERILVKFYLLLKPSRLRSQRTVTEVSEAQNNDCIPGFRIHEDPWNVLLQPPIYKALERIGTWTRWSLLH